VVSSRKEKLAVMRSSWQMDNGHRVCRWSEVGQSEVGQHVQYIPPWMQETSDIQGSYLPPVPDFAAHSRFGGAPWFRRYTPDSDCE